VSRRIVSNLPHPAGNSPDYSPNIFISRQKALGRRILNEQEVIAALAPLGFVAYTLEEMSFQEQVRLFSQAKAVVAPHGAGLANMMFAHNLKIIELFGSFVQPSFFYLAKGLGFWYGCLMGHSPSREIRQNDGNIVIDISQLKELVMMMQKSAEFSH
jgi:capsular polysaccharide biosynthesis protein